MSSVRESGLTDLSRNNTTAFPESSNPLKVPIVQVSLFKGEDPDQHHRLGQAIASLRDENIQIIVSGMAVHNLADLRWTMLDPTLVMPYTISFDRALMEAVTTAATAMATAVETKNVYRRAEMETETETTMKTETEKETVSKTRQDKMRALLSREDAREAHPSFDHLLPIYVGAGAARDDVGVQLWTLVEGSMSWAMYRFGSVS